MVSEVLDAQQVAYIDSVEAWAERTRHEVEAAQRAAEAELQAARSQAMSLIEQAERFAAQVRARALTTPPLDDGAGESGALSHARPVAALPLAAATAQAEGNPDAPTAATATSGHVTAVVGLVIRARLRDCALGEMVWIIRVDGSSLRGEVVGFRDGEALIMPLGSLAGVSAAARVERSFAPLHIAASEALLGRIVDPLGLPVDDGPPIAGARWPVDRAAPPPLARPRIARALRTGVRVIDGVVPLGQGQRVGLFAAAGVGKSTLLGQVVAGTGADVVVVCQVGERGREVRELLDGALASVRARTVSVVATADAAPLLRARAVQTATAIAEWFRDQGKAVLLMVDSLTRVARAQREVGLSAGEPVARHGYPPSVFALLPQLVERAGTAARGSITALYSVLVAGDDHDEPIADEVKGLLDGHWVLDRSLAERGQFPPVDVVRSHSRVATQITTAAHSAAAQRLRARQAVLADHRDLVTLGAYKHGSNVVLDAALAAAEADAGFLQQARADVVPWDTTVMQLLALGRAAQ